MDKHIRVFAFIDSQNLNMGVSCDVKRGGKKVYSGWKLDFKKFRTYLKDKHKVDTAFLFIGNLSGNEGLYEYLQRAGYVLILKPTTSYKDGDGKMKVKGNVDTDLVLYAAAREVNNYRQGRSGIWRWRFPKSLRIPHRTRKARGCFNS